MKFSMSQDGIPRGSVTIRFRVGVDLLHAAATDVVWTEMVDHPQTDAQAEGIAKLFAGKLTRARIVKQLRRGLQSNGYEWGGTDDEWWEVAHDATKPIIAKFWPDEVEATEAAKAAMA